MILGERSWNLKRLINLRLGLSRADDRLPKAFLTPFPDDPDGSAPDFQAMLEAYYEARRWDMTTGLPTREKMVQLGLDWILEKSI
jgi:aldehyde:ferredoxin oxidoreductase